MAHEQSKPQVLVIGPGMITWLQILPSLYHLQTQGVIGEIEIAGTRCSTMKTLFEDAGLKKGFPGQSFKMYPDFRSADANKTYRDAYKEPLKKLPPRQCVVVALPDQMHYPVIKEVLEHDQHVMTVKPFVLKYKEAVELEQLARKKGLVVGIEYHKRFDDRNFIARKRYRSGQFGELKAGQARLIEKYYYKHSNFQNWCTCDQTDAFTYIGCHYVDLVAFITGLKPVEVSVYSKPEPWPNGKLGYLWTDARVVWENGGVLSVVNGFAYPDDGPGGNTQGMMLWTEGKEKAGLIDHHDQFRGVKHSVMKAGGDPGDTIYMETNPDYFQLLEKGGKALTPVGYGFRSVEYIVKAIARAEHETAGLNEKDALAKRQALLDEYDREGIMATPKNSSYNELVVEAGRLSITNGGRSAAIEYGEKPRAYLK